MIKSIYHAFPIEFWQCVFLCLFLGLQVGTLTLIAFIPERGMTMKLSNKVYDYLKYIAQYILPALGTLYFALSTIWGLPYGEQIVGTITAVDAFLGAILGISTYNYKQEEKLLEE